MPQLSRRNLLALGSASAAGLALPAFAPRAQAQSPTALLNEAQTLLASVNNGFTFQNFMMDAYAQGPTVRLTQSYDDANVGLTAFTYDNAVAIHAYLAAGDTDDIARAEVLGQGLLYAQANNFPIADGRFAQAYFVNVASASGAYITPAAAPYFFYGSAVGDQAWPGMALAQLYRRTRNQAYLNGALAVANWIVRNTYDTQGPGGYRFGTVINQQNQSVPSTNGKSTEHNIDTYAFFTMLNFLTGDAAAENGQSWSALALHALQFVQALYNAAGPYYYTGTLGDQVTTNTSPIPEDVQTWSFLALLDPATQGTIDWALSSLVATDTASARNSSLTGSEQVRGLVFDTASLNPGVAGADPNAVWLEGTGHTAAALAARALRAAGGLGAIYSDLTQALTLLNQCALAQRTLGAGRTVGGRAIPQGLGLVAATSVLDTGFGYTYGPSLHILAARGLQQPARPAHPVKLGYRVIA